MIKATASVTVAKSPYSITLGHDLLVTPKEIDEFTEDIANIIASGLNAALHDAIDTNNVEAYTH